MSLNIKVNRNFSSIKESYLFSEVGARVRAYSEKNPDKRIIRLGIGDVTLPLPECAAAAMTEASRGMGRADGFHGYPPEYGHDFLRSAIARYYTRFGVTVSSDSVFVSDGAKSDIGNIVDILGDNPVWIPDPVYPVYLDSNIMSGRTVHFLPGNAENGFRPMPPLMRDVTGAVIYLCSPNNPTGAVYTKAELQQWVDFANDSGSLIIFDAAYEAFVSDDALPHTIYECSGADKCAVEICSFSKTAGFTGTRCAWTVIPAGITADGMSLAKLWARRQATKFNGVSYPVQKAAEAVLTDRGIAECKANIAYYMENAATLSALFDKKGICYTGGKSSPYIWLKCPGGMSSWGFFDYLLGEAQVVGTPGEGFGDGGRGYFRLTAFGTHENTSEAASRLDRLL